MLKEKILILAALPDRLRLDKEIREIESAIKRAVKRDLFEIKIRTAVRPQDIRRAIAEEHPQIVHFCGHGREDGSLVLEDDGGNHKPVLPTGLAALFKLHTDYVKCVLLNACYSALPAKAISQHINYAIGMNQSIEDRSAIVFAQGFYDGLGYNIINNQDVFCRAFDEGLLAIQMEDILQSSIPVLWKRGITQEKSESIEKCSNINYAPTQIEPDVKLESKICDFNSVREINYTRLQNLLASGNWKQADQETRSIMLKLAQREEEGWLDIESVSNFKSTDLSTINQLWVEYSHGRFGFSVQKCIWQNVKESEKAFCYKIGWRFLNKLIYHYNLTFSLDAPPGHLPFWGRGWSDGRMWVKEAQIGQWADALLERQDFS